MQQFSNQTVEKPQGGGGTKQNKIKQNTFSISNWFYTLVSQNIEREWEPLEFMLIANTITDVFKKPQM